MFPLRSGARSAVRRALPRIAWKRSASCGRSRPRSAGSVEDARIAVEPEAPVVSGGRKRKRSRTKEKLFDLDLAEAERMAPPGMIEARRALRGRHARSRGIPAYCIFNDATLSRIAAAMPQDEKRLLSIKGVGPGIVEKYGAELLELVRSNG